MRHSRFPFFWTIGLLASNAALAKNVLPEAHLSAASCLDKATTQGELDACAGMQASEADKLLNHAYQSVMKYFCQGDAERDQLVASERAWLAFRNADCAFWGAGGGSIAPMNQAFCVAELSRQRAKELDGWPPNSPRESPLPCK
jgi:uncharacterized protein YecT (DUF1311 family)